MELPSYEVKMTRLELTELMHGLSAFYEEVAKGKFDFMTLALGNKVQIRILVKEEHHER
jgi:hypothetical protein